MNYSLRRVRMLLSSNDTLAACDTARICGTMTLFITHHPFLGRLAQSPEKIHSRGPGPQRALEPLSQGME
jgi:hypothetical protein